MNKKIIYFSLFLFVIAFLFVIYNRLSNGMPINLGLSFAYAISMTSPFLIGIWKGFRVHTATQLSGFKLYLKIIPAVGGTAIFAGLLFAILMSAGVTGEMSGLKVIIYPIIDFIFILAVAIVMFLFIILITNRAALKFAIIIGGGAFFLLSGTTVALLNHCGVKGCGDQEFLTKTALAKNNFDFCSTEKVIRDDSFISTLRLDIPLLFGTGSSKEDFLYLRDSDCSCRYAAEKKDMKACDYNGCFDHDTCIQGILVQNPKLEECEKLDPALKISCYFSLAKITKSSNYCEKIPKGERYDICKISVSGDIKACTNLSYERGAFYSCISDFLSDNPKPDECEKLRTVLKTFRTEFGSDISPISICYAKLAIVTLNGNYCEKVQEDRKRSCQRGVESEIQRIEDVKRIKEARN